MVLTVTQDKVTDDNILQAIEENWQVDKFKDGQSVKKANPTIYEAYVAPLLNDPRDIPVFNVALVGTLLPISSMLMYSFGFSYVHALLHSALFFTLLRKYVLALHVSSHSSLFIKPLNFMNYWIPLVLAPYFGQTPFSYYWHHLKMHHVTDNGPNDLSTTLFLQRDSLFHFLLYFGRFFVFAWIELPLHFFKKKQLKPVIQIFFFDSGSVILLILTMFVWQVYVPETFFSFLLPMIIVRFGMMQGNWVQHAFLDPIDPLGGGLHNSITLVHCDYNKECFNDGYHASHHLNPKRHWLDHPAELVTNRKIYIAQRAIVFKESSYDDLWWLLMTKNYDKLAEKWVHVGDETNIPSKEQIIDTLKKKTHQFTREEIDVFLKKGK